MIGIGETALLLSTKEKRATITGIYLHLMCAVSYVELKQDEQALLHMQKAFDMGLPDGFLTPFAEHVTSMGGRMETFLKVYYPDFRKPVMKQCENTLSHWIVAHNMYARDNITDLLSVQEYQVVSWATRGMTNAEIAATLNCSVSNVKRNLESVFHKLLISKRSELNQYIVWKLLDR